MNTTKSLPSWTRPAFFTIVLALAFNNTWRHSIIFGDTYFLFAPIKSLIAEALKKGTVYAWYPWERGGMPFVGNIISGWFYPLNLLFLLFSVAWAMKIFLFIHYVLAATFADLMLRKLGLDKHSSAFGGLAFSLSGYMVGQHKNLAFLIGPAWAPLAVYFMLCAIEGSSLWALGTAAVLTVQLLAGEVQNTGVTALIVIFIGLIAAFKSSRRRTALTSIVLACAPAILLSAAQWLPTFELMRLSTRSHGVSFGESVIFSFHPALTIELIWPLPFGRLYPETIYWAEFVVHNIIGHTPWSASNYMGLSVFVLAIVGVIYSRRQWKIWTGAGMIFFLLLSFGRYAPLYAAFYRYIPLFDLFRYPAKYMGWFTGFTVVGAALGMEHVILLLEKNSGVLAGAAIAYVVMIIIGAVIAVLVWPIVVGAVTGIAPTEEEFHLIKSYLMDGTRQWLAFNVVAGLILLALSRKIISLRIGITLFFVMLILDYYLTNISPVPIGPPDIYDFPPVAARVISPEGRPELGQFRICQHEMFFYGADPALESLTFLEQYAFWRRNYLINNFPAMEGFEAIFGYSAAKFPDQQSVFTDKRYWKMLELYNVKYAISDSSKYKLSEDVKAEIIHSNPHSNIIITRMPNAWPRAYWAPTVKAASGDKEALAMLDSVNFKKAAVVTTKDHINEPDAGDREIGPINITRYEPDHVVLASDTDSPGWLVLSDRYYPGWNAFVDGNPVKIYKANVFVRAIPIEPGKHKIDFVYRPVPLRIGMAVSLVSWILLFFVGRKMKRRKL